ncbi:hypothetical protein SAMN05428945_3736 [Streptomyces sp. 2224.1]|nr:hypothetical protein [Streptomyces sp. 2224.1]PBC81723.1 hypothetical protein BX261_1604 [Streptomyces sp. 2321.6]SDR53442.1 hypothetical protein SAMN05216511_5614 [Streptomyces sp. KS_16]SEC27780.1 hypothetical protein SAMN05428940_1604 [Streptomyces sp. 2133.1]SNC66309.1 hypothetical protein SAMN06272741_1600 [Streptomyces sp. 2114.4]SED06906.1 hypothetical protein SAMN05428945_3736 [Streptomyces sp. 2224.1]
MAALAAMRADTSPLTGKHPAHVFRPLSEVLSRWAADGIDITSFHAGVENAKRRYAGHGLAVMLPLDRVLVGCESSRAGAFGGFHHPDQGYRHLQMVAVITMFGPMERRNPECPALALLDLLRAYAHDCLHYGSRRRYVEVAGAPVRTQYGINYRRTKGQCYSAADKHGSRHTRNLGVVMEGACDREARDLTRQTAERFGVTEPSDVLGALAFRDVTGTLTEVDTGRVVDLLESTEQTRYAAALNGYESGVNRRYAVFLGDYAPGEEDDFHAILLTAIISGDVRALGMWLDDRHGPGTFMGLFRSPGYFEPS